MDHHILCLISTWLFVFYTRFLCLLSGNWLHISIWSYGHMTTPPWCCTNLPSYDHTPPMSIDSIWNHVYDDGSEHMYKISGSGGRYHTCGHRTRQCIARPSKRDSEIVIHVYTVLTAWLSFSKVHRLIRNPNKVPILSIQKVSCTKKVSYVLCVENWQRHNRSQDHRDANFLITKHNFHKLSG